MRIHDVLGLYMGFTVIASRIHRRGTRGLIIALIFCFTTNSIWSKAVDASLIKDSFLHRSINLVGPLGANAKVTVWEGKKEAFSSEVTLKGLRENINVPFRFTDTTIKREVRVQFTSGYYGIFRSHVKFVLEPIKVS